MPALPIIIKKSPFYPSVFNTGCTLKNLINHWLSFKENYTINQTPFKEHILNYDLNQADSYLNTREKRFQTFIDTECLSPLCRALSVNLNQEKKNSSIRYFYQWLIKYSIENIWQITLQNRLHHGKKSSEGYCSSENNLNYQNNAIVLKQTFNFSSHRNSPDNAEYVEYQGESTIKLILKDERLITDLIEGSAALFDAKKQEDFLSPSLDEKINARLNALNSKNNKIERLALKASRDYYLCQLSAQALQQLFISQHLYSDNFKSSEGFSLIAQVLKEKPIKGLSL